MASFYTKDQLDVLAQVVGNRIKNSVTDIRIANELEKSPEHKLITKSYKQSIDALISGSTTDPEKNYTAAENIISFIDALDNGYVAITPEIPSDTEEPLEIEVGPNNLEGEETFRFRSTVSPEHVDPLAEVGVGIALFVLPEGSWEVKDPITNTILANSEGVILPHVYLDEATTPDSPLTMTIYHETEEEMNYSVSGDIMALSLYSTGGAHAGEDVRSLPVDPEGSPGIVEILAFSKHINYYNFGVDWNLKVPRRLPKNITSTIAMFEGCSRFNQNINTWNTINVTNMEGMFARTIKFNQPLNDWNTSNVTNMSNMFSDTTTFNQPLNNWDTSSVTTMDSMFSRAASFNQHLYGWNTSNVENMRYMFNEASSFNKPIRIWDVSKVTSFASMFRSARRFNQDLDIWDVSRILTKPTSFDSYADKWTKTRPLWGEVVERPLVDDTDYTDPVVAPKPVWEIKTVDRTVPSTFKFNTYSALNPEELEIEIRVDGIEGPWTLYKDGAILATQDTENTISPPVDFDATSGNLYVRTVGDKNIASYEFEGVAEDINISYFATTDTGITEEPAFYRMVGDEASSSRALIESETAPDLSNLIVEGVIQVESYSSTVKKQSFNVPNIDLIVPSDIPETMRSLNYAFHGSTMFNQDISGWDVSNIVSMQNTFHNAIAFNQPIGAWNVGKVGSTQESGMDYMFREALSFKQDLSQWCVGYVEILPDSFGNYLLSREELPVWGTCPRQEVPLPVRNFEFSTNNESTGSPGELTVRLTVAPETEWTLFNSETEEVISSSETNATGTVLLGDYSTADYNHYRFEGQTDNLKLLFEDNATNGYPQTGGIYIERFSNYISSYNLNAGKLKLYVPNRIPSCITSANSMFKGSYNFDNSSVTEWDVSNITDMASMFEGCSAFKGGGRYSSMPNWDVSNVTNMEGMFKDNYLFNIDLSNWCVSNFSEEPLDFSTDAVKWIASNKPVWGTCPYRSLEEFWDLNPNPRVLLNSSSNSTPSNLNCNFKFEINGDVYNEDLSLDITDIGPWSDRVSVFKDETTGLLGFSANQSEWLEIILTIPENMRQYYNQFDLGTGMIAEDGRIYFIIYATE